MHCGKPGLHWAVSVGADADEEVTCLLTEWMTQLDMRFKKNVFESRREADDLKFRSSTEDSMPLREYIEIMLLAGKPNLSSRRLGA